MSLKFVGWAGVRAAAVLALSAMGTKGDELLIRALEPLLQDPEPEVFSFLIVHINMYHVHYKYI